MSASVYLACGNATRGVPNNSVRLTLDANDIDAPRAVQGEVLVLSKRSVPLYAIRQIQAQEDADSPA